MVLIWKSDILPFSNKIMKVKSNSKTSYENKIKGLTKISHSQKQMDLSKCYQMLWKCQTDINIDICLLSCNSSRNNVY